MRWEEKGGEGGVLNGSGFGGKWIGTRWGAALSEDLERLDQAGKSITHPTRHGTNRIESITKHVSHTE